MARQFLTHRVRLVGSIAALRNKHSITSSAIGDVELGDALREPSGEPTINPARAEVSSSSSIEAGSEDRWLQHDGFPGRHAFYEILSIPN
jgi:hypothetical protein